MADYSTLKAAIADYVKDRTGLDTIDGDGLQETLLAMVNSLGANFQFAGVAKLTPAQTDPGTPDQNVFYIAAEPGSYTNFPTSGGYLQVAENEVAIFKYNGQWSKETTGAATNAQVNQLGQYVDNPEWVRVVTDANDKILYGVKTDGKFYFGDGCPSQVQEYVLEKIDEYGENVVSVLLATKVDKVIGKSLIDADFASSQSAIENPEWIDVTVDSDERILRGRHADGTVVENVGIISKRILTDNLELSADAKVNLINALGVRNTAAIIYKDGLKRGGTKFYDVSALGSMFYVHVYNPSEYACKLPLDWYTANKEKQWQAAFHFRGTDQFYNENVKYGRVYLKAGEGATILVEKGSSSKYLGVDTSDINTNTTITFEVCDEGYGLSLEKTGACAPYLGSGKYYIQPMNFNYGHGSRVVNVGKWLLVFFCGGQRDSLNDTGYPTDGQYMTLAIVEKGNYNNIVYKIYDGFPNDTGEYDIGNSNIRVCAKDNDVYILYYGYNRNNSVVKYYLRKFDTLTFEFSAPQDVYLSYDGNTVRWTKRNELIMLNDLYGANLEIADDPKTEIGDMRLYNGYFYTIIGGQSKNLATDNYPWTLYKSADGIIWEPVACINANDKTAEVVFDISQDIILCQIRSTNLGGHYHYNGYMVCDISGNVLKTPTFLSEVDSKGSVFVKNGELYIVYNIEYDNAHYFGRNKIALAKLNLEDYSLTTLKTYIDLNGFQYFDFNCKDDIVFMSNTEDPRGYNYNNPTAGPYGGGISIAIVNEEVFANE